MLTLPIVGVAAEKSKASPSFIPGGNSKEPIAINAAKLDYLDKEQKLIYSGGVTMTQGESQMKASVVTIFLMKSSENDPGGKPAASAGPTASSSSVKRLEATGPVTVTSKDQVGTGDNLVYDKIQNKVFLTGNAVLSQGSNITKGGKLIYDLNTSEAHIEADTKGGSVESVFTPGSGADPTAGDGSKKPAKKPKAK